MEWAKLKPKFQQKYCNDNGLGQAMNDTNLNVKRGGIFANFSQRACRCKTRNKTFSYKLWERTVLVCEMDGGEEFPFDTSKSIKRGCAGE